MRAIGLDVHRDFCEVAIAENGEVRSTGRIAATHEQLELFGASLAPTDQIALEVTGNCWEIARILNKHVAHVLVVNPADTGIRQARAKTDRRDARTLARLLAVGSLTGVWMPDDRTRVMRRRLARRQQLVQSRTRAKNEISAVLIRCLKARPKISDLFGVKGRAWLAQIQLPFEERESIDAGLRLIAFLDGEIIAVEQLIAQDALQWPEVARLMTVPGVNVIVASTFLAAIGDIRRFPSSRKLVGYLGLDPKVRQSGSTPAAHGHISRQGLRPSPPRPGRGELEHNPPARPDARLLPARPRPPRTPDRRRCVRAKTRRAVLVSAQTRRGLCLPAAVADQEEDAPPGTHRRPPQGSRQDRHLGHQRRHARRRTRAGRAGRTGLQTQHRRLASHQAAKGGRKRDNAARIYRALKGLSRAANHSPRRPRFATSITRARTHLPTPPRRQQQDLTFIPRAKHKLPSCARVGRDPRPGRSFQFERAPRGRGRCTRPDSNPGGAAAG